MPKNTMFPLATYRLDPYRNFKFRVKWDGRYVAGVHSVSAMKRTTEVITHRTGGDPSTPRRMPGQSSYEAITLERGVTHDTEFELWANKVWSHTNMRADDQQGGKDNKDVSLKDFRKDIIIELYNEAGQKALAYKVFRCWPSEYSPLPKLDGNGNAVAIQTLVLENEGWERDLSVPEPTEPSYTQPG